MAGEQRQATRITNGAAPLARSAEPGQEGQGQAAAQHETHFRIPLSRRHTQYALV